MRGDGLGDVFDAAGGAGVEQVPHVALVLVRAGRADRGPAVAAAHVGDPVRLAAGVVGLDQPPARGVGGAAAADPDRAGAVTAAFRLVGPAVEVGPGGAGAHLRHRGRHQIGQRHRGVAHGRPLLIGLGLRRAAGCAAGGPRPRRGRSGRRRARASASRPS